jgi:PAS domain S-box-containing protein
MYVWWGAELLCFYNDAFRLSIGPERHPGSLGQPAREVWAEIWPIIGPQIEQVMSGGGATWQENALAPITRNGAREDAYWTYSYGPIDDEASPNGIGGVLVVCSETTRQTLAAQRAVEGAVDRGEAQFQMLVKSVTDYAIYMLDPQGYVSSWNLGAQRIKGYRPDEIIGEHFSRFYTEEDRASGVPERGLEVARREGRFETEGWRVRKDGSRFRAHAIIDAIPGEGGDIIGFAKITRDVTEQDRARRALDEAREALFQSQKLEAIGQLTGGIAHDFNNLLMAVLASLELAQKRLPDDPQINRLITNAIQGARRGASLTQRMLAFARRQELERETIELPDLVYGITDLLNRALGPLFTLDIELPPRLPAVESDATQLEAALMNVVVNARDAMPGGGTIEIRARHVIGETGAQDQAPGNYVCLSVIDHGEGMSEATLARATEPFFTTKGVGKGTGLGLAMIHGLARQSGGALRIKSAVGVGTTVELWLPVAGRRTGAAHVVVPETTASFGREPLVVLAVDDDELVLLNTAAMLEDLGHTVLQASSAEEAVRILRIEPTVDLLITDHAMPKMTGAQLARVVAAERPDLPIILATGYAELPQGEGAGVARLAKPFGQRQLAQAIGRVALRRAASTSET